MTRPIRFVTHEEQLEAQQILRDRLQKADDDDRRMGKAVIAQMARGIWPYTYATTSSDELARDNWVAYIDSKADPEERFILSEQMKLSDFVILNLGAGRWYSEGLPVFRPGHKQAASYMATSVSVEMAEHVKPPFRAFYIELPIPLLEISDPDGKMQPLVGVFVHVYTATPERDGQDPDLPAGDYWRWIAMTEKLTLWEMNRRVEELITGTILPEDEYFGLGWEMDDHDNRVRLLIKRLIVSLCLAMASKPQRQEPKSKGKKKKGSKKAKEGLSFNFIASPTEVEVDARPYVRAFLTGDRKNPDFRQMVEGHWKNQAYGPKFSLRRPQYIRPYRRLEHLPERPG